MLGTIYFYLIAETLGVEHRHHDVDLVAIVDIGIGHHVVVALGVDVELVLVVVVVVYVVVDVDDDRKDVERCGEEGHLCDAHGSGIRGCRAPVGHIYCTYVCTYCTECIQKFPMFISRHGARKPGLDNC
jgi:hypothetical protein